MAVSYKKLWKILIDKDMKKKDLQVAAGVSWVSITKLSKSKTVSMDVLIKIYKVNECDFGDIMELKPDDPDKEESDSCMNLRRECLKMNTEVKKCPKISKPKTGYQ
jgi:DNA-binding Xre family transcriptional regulator